MTAERGAALALVVSMFGSIGLVVIYVLGGQPQVEGVLLALALGGVGVALSIWAVALLDVPIGSEERHPLASAPEVRREAGDAAEVGSIARRTLLVRLLAGAAALLAAALAIPALSLGPEQGRSLFRTEWAPGRRVVGDDGRPVAAADVEQGTVVTVYPEGHVGSAEAATLLVRVRPEDLRLPTGREDWAPDGILGYSKLCTHAGCPVGLYRAEDRSLLCPCHQSTFDVVRGAVPTFGPAARPLPQLPLALDDEGHLVARGDFPEPVGPSFWNVSWEQDA
jgi:ubiquinol-cytochrome c reductase iron-sulfur subunit